MKETVVIIRTIRISSPWPLHAITSCTLQIWVFAKVPSLAVPSWCCVCLHTEHSCVSRHEWERRLRETPCVELTFPHGALTGGTVPQILLLQHHASGRKKKK